MRALDSLSIRAKLLGKSFAILAMMAIVSVIVYASLVSAELRESEVKRSFQIIGQTNELLYLLSNNQSASRAYIITGNEQHLRSIADNWDSYASIMRELDEQVQDEAVHELLDSGRCPGQRRDPRGDGARRRESAHRRGRSAGDRAGRVG
jgi:CHASE3 domain sensor protein